MFLNLTIITEKTKQIRIGHLIFACYIRKRVVLSVVMSFTTPAKSNEIAGIVLCIFFYFETSSTKHIGDESRNTHFLNAVLNC